MKTIFSILFTVFSFFASAQIIFTRNDYGRNGDQVLYAIDSPIYSPINFGSTGANHTWIFQKTNTTPKRYDSTKFISAISDPNAPGVSANMLLRTAAYADQYQEITDSFVKMIIDMPAYHIKGVKLKLFDLPLSYHSNSIDSTTTSAKGLLSDFGIAPITGVDSIRIDAKIYMNGFCDGWGNLTLPDSTQYNCLRLNSTTFINASIFIHSILGWNYIQNRTQTNTNYLWLAPNSKSYVANVALDTSGNISSFTYKVQYVVPKKISPKIVSISPDSMMQGQSMNVTIITKGTHFTQLAKSDISFYTNPSYYTADSFLVVNDTTLIAIFKSTLTSAIGWTYVEIYTSTDGYFYLSNSFKILPNPIAPSLISVSPGFGIMGQSQGITIKGMNTHFTKGGAINFNLQNGGGFININSILIPNDSIIYANVQLVSATTHSSFTLITYDSIDGYLYLNSSFSAVNTGINNIFSNSSIITIYPNPAKEEIALTILTEAKNILFEVYDIRGQIVSIEQPVKNNSSYIFPLKNISSGIYFIKITDLQTGKFLSKKFIKE